MKKSTRQGIQAHVGIKVNALTTDALFYTRKLSKGDANDLVLHLAFNHILDVMIPGFIDDAIAYCVSVRVRKAEEIAEELKWLSERLPAIGESLAKSFHVRSVGAVQREVENFKARARGLVGQVLPKARAEVEVARAKDPPLAARLKDAPPIVVIGVVGTLLAALLGIFGFPTKARETWRSWNGSPSSRANATTGP